MINKALQAKPADMVITTHVCRGNFRSTWISSGGYEPVAERCSARCNYDGYFLEYDTDRAGGFEPLRFLPKGKKIVVLGARHVEDAARWRSKDDIKRRIDEATKYVALDQLALSPQCGFASTEEGNVLDRGGAMGEAADDRRAGRGGVGLSPLSRRRDKKKNREGVKQMSQRTTPPFRADHVGSLLRPAPLKEARAKRAKGEIDAAAA